MKFLYLLVSYVYHLFVFQLLHPPLLKCMEIAGSYRQDVRPVVLNLNQNSEITLSQERDLRFLMFWWEN